MIFFEFHLKNNTNRDLLQKRESLLFVPLSSLELSNPTVHLAHENIQQKI